MSISDYDLRQRFLKGELPRKGESNDYFYFAALQCKDDGLTQTQALEKIKIIYDKWEMSEYFSKRPWSNIQIKIEEAYR